MSLAMLEESYKRGLVISLTTHSVWQVAKHQSDLCELIMTVLWRRNDGNGQNHPPKHRQI